MFTAIVMICQLYTNNCLIASDTRGPYTTFEECEVRIIEMLTELSEMMGPFELRHQACKKNEGDPV